MATAAYIVISYVWLITIIFKQTIQTKLKSIKLNQLKPIIMKNLSLLQGIKETANTNNSLFNIITMPSMISGTIESSFGLSRTFQFPASQEIKDYFELHKDSAVVLQTGEYLKGSLQLGCLSLTPQGNCKIIIPISVRQEDGTYSENDDLLMLDSRNPESCGAAIFELSFHLKGEIGKSKNVFQKTGFSVSNFHTKRGDQLREAVKENYEVELYKNKFLAKMQGKNNIATKAVITAPIAVQPELAE